MNWSDRQRDRLADYFQKIAILVFAGALADRETGGWKILMAAFASGVFVLMSVLVDQDETGG